MKTILAATTAALLVAMSGPVLACSKGGASHRVQHVKTVVQTPAAKPAQVTTQPGAATAPVERTGATSALSVAAPAT